MTKHSSGDQLLSTKVFFDTEFTDLLGIAQDPALISIGLITEDGMRTFYAELTDTYTLEQCSDFVHVGVLPLLDAPELPEVLDLTAIYARVSATQCRDLLTQWLAQAGKHAELWSDAPSYDWHFVVELFHEHVWPKVLSQIPRSCLPLEEASLSRHSRRVEQMYATQRFRRHHALDDARVNREVWLVESAERQRS